MSKRLNNCVYDKRLEKNVTQEFLAQSIGVTRQTIIAIEKGNYTPSVALALKLSDFFKTYVEEFVSTNPLDVEMGGIEPPCSCCEYTHLQA